MVDEKHETLRELAAAVGATAARAGAGGRTTVADLVRTDVLGWFLHGCITWLDRAEELERAGETSDDRFAKGVQNVGDFIRTDAAARR